MDGTEQLILLVTSWADEVITIALRNPEVLDDCHRRRVPYLHDPDLEEVMQMNGLVQEPQTSKKSDGQGWSPKS